MINIEQEIQNIKSQMIAMQARINSIVDNVSNIDAQVGVLNNEQSGDDYDVVYTEDIQSVVLNTEDLDSIYVAVVTHDSMRPAFFKYDKEYMSDEDSVDIVVDNYAYDAAPIQLEVVSGNVWDILSTQEIGSVNEDGSQQQPDLSGVQYEHIITMNDTLAPRKRTIYTYVNGKSGPAVKTVEAIPVNSVTQKYL